MYKNKQGFTLIEIIFSVAFLSIVSLIMLKLLFASYDLEKHIDVQDVASIKVANLTEHIKSDYHNIQKEQLIYYDAKFNETTPQEAVYTLKASCKKNEEGFGRLYDIFVQLTNDDGEIIVRLETKHYFGKE
ncbi:MAG: prepilin-type N-terminal cleavage/methylation domain-containing protein [Clostridia bacterium]|nr:prepilin-type N-terminal cleavage/methylation domain-containing protein [Clostridia bacterium]